MKNIIPFMALFLISLALAACTQGVETPPNELTPSGAALTPTPPVEKPGEASPSGPESSPLPAEGGDRGSVYIDTQEIAVGDTTDSIFLVLQGNLPTPCHRVQAVVNKPDAENRIYVEVYSTMEAGKMCAQVISPFGYTVKIAGLANGSYSLYLNGEKIAEFSIPFTGQVSG